ncbi:hypothetical protein CR513_33997, partial [Mucuna pruriens]
MTRFFHGLNIDIQVETQLKRHGRKSYPTTHSNWRGKDKIEEKILRRDKCPKKGSAPFKGHQDEVSKYYSLIIDGGSSMNVVSLKLEEKLELPIIPHPRPYKFHWLSEKGKRVVK